MSRTALIVGAGIGGLSAGIALRRAGWNVRIFERASSPRELGFGVALAPNAIAALRELGVADLVLARGFAPTRARAEVRRMDGTVLKRIDLAVRQALGGAMVIALRPALHGALLAAVGLESITLGCDVSGFTTSRASVAVQTANGEVEGDVLIGADGAGSVVRRQLHPDEPPPRPSGLLAVRGSAHGVLDHLRDLDGLYYLGPGVESAIVRASETGIYWFLSLAREVIPPGIDAAAGVLAHMAPQFDDAFRAITAASDDLRLDELFDRDPIRTWGRGHVTLLGDAAHPMLPHTAQGAAQAIVDAVWLGNTFSAEMTITQALRAYEAERAPRTAALVRQGRRTARLMRSTNRVVNSLRELVVRSIPVGPMARVFVRINRRAGTDRR